MVTILVLCAIALIIIFIATFNSDARNPVERVGAVPAKKYSLDIGVPAAYLQAGTATVRQRLLDKLFGEVTQLIQINQQKLWHEGFVNEFQRQEEFGELTNTLKVELTKRAASQGIDYDTYLELQKRYYSNRLDLDRNWEEAMQGLKAGFTYQLQGYQHLQLILEYLKSLYEQSRQLQAAGKDREYNLMEDHIKFMENDFNERQKLLQRELQTGNGQGFQAGESDTNNSGDTR